MCAFYTWINTHTNLWQCNATTDGVSPAQSEMESSTCREQTPGSKRTADISAHKHATSIIYLNYFLFIVVLLWWTKKGRKRLQIKTIKSLEKQTEGKGGGSREVQRGSVRHTNPYFKRWRLIQLRQQSQHSGNDGLWEGEERQKAMIWCTVTRWDLNDWVCRDRCI